MLKTTNTQEKAFFNIACEQYVENALSALNYNSELVALHNGMGYWTLN